MPVIEVDFTGVESGAGFLEPGVYRAQVEKVESREGANYPGLSWTWSSIEPETFGQRSNLFTSLSPKSLWVLKGILEAFGAEIPQSAMRLNTDKLIGKKALIKVINEPWTDAAGESHDSSKIDRVFKIQGETQPSGNGGQSQKARPLVSAARQLDERPAPDDYSQPDFDDDPSIPF